MTTYILSGYKSDMWWSASARHIRATRGNRVNGQDSGQRETEVATRIADLSSQTAGNQARTKPGRQEATLSANSPGVRSAQGRGRDTDRRLVEPNSRRIGPARSR